MGHGFSTQTASRLIVALSAVVAVPRVSQAADLQYGKYLTANDVDKTSMVKRYVRAGGGGFHLVAVSKYEVRTKVDPEFTLRMAFLMDDFHAKFSSVFKGRFALFNKPKLYLLEDQESYQTFVRGNDGMPSWSIGMFMRRGTESILASYKMEDAELERVLFHEGTHQLLHAYIGDLEIPTWFNEGVATNFETWDLGYTAPENVRRSIINSYRRHVAVEAMREGTALSIGKLIGISPMEWSMAEDPQINYAMAWSLVNYLLSTNTGKDNLNKILSAIKKGGDLKKLLTWKVLIKLEDQWHKDMQTRMVLYDEHIVPALYLAGEKLTEQALAKANEGVAAYPQSADARYCRGVVRRAAGKYEEAVADFFEAMKTDTYFPRLYTELGRCYKEMGDKTQALKYLNKAVRRNEYNKAASSLLKEINGR